MSVHSIGVGFRLCAKCRRSLSGIAQFISISFHAYPFVLHNRSMGESIGGISKEGAYEIDMGNEEGDLGINNKFIGG